MTRVNLLGLILIAYTSICSSPASASATAFDCDVPPDHFSSVSQDVIGPMAIRGSVQVVQLREGNNLPVAGARLVSTDDSNSIGFQLVAASTRAKQFDVVLAIKRDNDPKRKTVAQIANADSILFDLSLSSTGEAILTIGGRDFKADFMPLSGGKEMAFCSTAQFKFTGLLFSQDDVADATTTR